MFRRRVQSSWQTSTGLGSTALKVNTGAVTCDEVERLGGEAEGYKEIRLPTADLTDFKMSFELRSEEHREWLEWLGDGRPQGRQCRAP